jgi:hypothetical protein
LVEGEGGEWSCAGTSVAMMSVIKEDYPFAEMFQVLDELGLLSTSVSFFEVVDSSEIAMVRSLTN